MTFRYQHLFDYISVMRIDHWSKNVFYLSGAVFAFFFDKIPFTMNTVGSLLLTFGVFGLIASANYILNEIIDSPFDRFHPVKKFRAVPSNRVSIPILYVIHTLLLAIAFMLSYHFLPPPLLFISLSFFLSGLIYNVPPVRLKDVPILDVVTESINNPIRFLAGWYTLTTNTPSIFLLIAFWALGAFWMAGKRYGELLFLSEQKSDITGYRKSLTFYTPHKLLVFIGCSCLLFFLGYTATAIQESRKLFLALPFFVIYFWWYYHLIRQNDLVVREPETFFRKPLFFAYTLFLSVVFYSILFL